MIDINTPNLLALTLKLPTIAGNEPYDHSNFDAYFAKSDLWQHQDGFRLDEKGRLCSDIVVHGVPYIARDQLALATFFGLHEYTTQMLFKDGYVKYHKLTLINSTLLLIYGVPVSEITPDMVVKVIQGIIENGEEAFLDDIENKVQQKFKEIQPPPLKDCMATFIR